MPNNDWKWAWRVGLCEDIRSMILKEDCTQLGVAMNDMMTNKTTINLNMFSTLMEDIIMKDLNSISIVTIKNSRRGLSYIRTNQQPTKPKEFRCSIRKVSMLWLNAKTRYNSVLLATSGDKRIIQKETESSGRSAICRMTS